jgi:glycosyltransferase involved in cell wall biosynthesis
MAKLSVIIPFVQEWPMNVFTIRNIAEELRDRVDFEIIAVDNWCDQVQKQYPDRENDRSSAHLKALMRGHKWLKLLEYKDKLSHWQAKNLGVKHSTGKWLFFCDAHCIVSRDSLYNMFQYVSKDWCSMTVERKEDEKALPMNPMFGSIHLPLTYHIMEYHSLTYKLSGDWQKGGDLGYSFTPFRPEIGGNSPVYRVPAMSTCGMMISRQLYDYFGGWPKELGIYGGGENFINFVLAVLGKEKLIFKAPPLCHHGDKRGYHYLYDDFTRNRVIANYMFGGKKWALRFAENRKGDKNANMAIYQDVITKCAKHRELIKSRQTITIEDWIKEWS